VVEVFRGAAQSQGRSEKGNLHAWSHGQECAGEADTQVVDVLVGSGGMAALKRTPNACREGKGKKGSFSSTRTALLRVRLAG
jgi:hypothetical protein